MTDKVCYLCNLLSDDTIAEDGFVTRELRPYGEKGQWVCFDCAFRTPQQKIITETMFELQINAAGSMPVIGLEVGPIPLKTLGEMP